MAQNENFGFRDTRNSAELLLAPAIPASRTNANLGSLKLNIGGKASLPGTIGSATDLTGSVRNSFANILSTQAATQQVSKTLNITLKSFDVNRSALQNGSLTVQDPLLQPKSTGIPSAASFLQFSSLAPGKAIPASFNAIINQRKNALQALTSRSASVFSGSSFKGVSITENYARTNYPLDSEFELPSIPRLAQGGAVAAADNIIKDKSSFVVAGVTIGAGKPSFWSRLTTLAQIKAVPSLNTVVNQIFKDRRNQGSWSEPPSPYASQYPYNKVQQTESGHVFELDDTPSAERIHIFHRSGSFIEWHPDGTVVYKNMKNGFSITMGDHHVKVNGDYHVAVDGNSTVYVKGNVNLQADGEINMRTKKDFNVYADGDINMRSKKTFKGDGTKIDLRYIQLPLSLIPVPQGGGFAPRVNLAALKQDFPNSGIDQALTQMAKNPMDPKAANVVLRLTANAVAIPPENPLSNPGIYTLKSTAAIGYRTLLFDTPEETGDFELYTSHVGLQKTLGDIPKSGNDPRAIGGSLTKSSVVTDAKNTASVDYLDYSTFKGVFSYANDYVLGSTTFHLSDLVDIALYPDIVKPIKEPTTVIAGGISGGGAGSGSSGGDSGSGSDSGGSGGDTGDADAIVGNRIADAKAVDLQNPGLIQSDSAAYTNKLAIYLNSVDGTNNWGRKARNSDGSSLNGDALAYRLDPSDLSRKVLIDVVNSSDSPDASPTWSVISLDESDGVNGYWAPPE